jgi:hypothetical protein
MAAPRQTAVDTARQAAERGARAMRVQIKRSPHRGVWLKARPVPDQDAGPEQRLLEQFSPRFVIFPDASRGSSPPSKPGCEDYHPRPVEAYLRHARPYMASPSGWVAGVYVFLFTGVVTGLAKLWLDRLVGPGPDAPTLRIELYLALALVIVALLLVAEAPTRMDGVRRRVAKCAPTDRLGIRRTWLELPLGAWWPNKAWRDYEREVVDSDTYPRRIYGRVVPVGEDRYLQYWQFYVFNDWHNKHEADWEVVVVLVRPAEDGWTQVGAAYSSHFGGHWRPREEIHWREGTHPVAYVAQGSHAQYFESKGHTAMLTQSFGTVQIQIGRKDWRDEVAADPASEEDVETYEIAVLPDAAPETRWSDEDVAKWWWLRYRGLWGGGGGIPGPMDQGAKWSDPAKWIEDAVQRDSRPWAELVASEAADVR